MLPPMGVHVFFATVGAEVWFVTGAIRTISLVGANSPAVFLAPVHEGPNALLAAKKRHRASHLTHGRLSLPCTLGFLCAVNRNFR